MGCFCQETVRALRPDHALEQPKDQSKDQPAPTDPDDVIPAVSDWLAARWLPAPAWEPDPEWIETELPDPPMEPAALSVIIGMIQAQQACETHMAVDATDPDQVSKLARIVGTLNRRMDDLAWIEEDATPWQSLAARNDQIDTVRAAVEQGVFAPPPDEKEPPFAPWRPLFAKLKALAPLVAVAQLLKLDFSETAAPDRLAEKVRALRQVKLPKLENPMRVMRVIARAQAITRLRDSLGADPLEHPWARLEAAVERKAAAVAERLPENLRVQQGKPIGLAPRQPNPSQIINADMLRLAEKISPEALTRLQWRVPSYDQIDLLTTAAPVATLARLMHVMGQNPIRATPCGRDCDAGAVARELAAPTGARGNGTGAGPVG